jgi:hypothetical protein
VLLSISSLASSLVVVPEKENSTTTCKVYSIHFRWQVP